MLHAPGPSSSVDLSAAFNALSSATLIVDAMVAARPILYANPACAELTGYAC